MSIQLDGLKSRIQALRAKTVDNGCTESEALSAAAKVAELLDRYDLSLSDVEIREAACEKREFETFRKKRVPLDGCVGAVAHFCDCRVWREKNAAGEARYVFFGLRSDVEVAHYLTELIDGAVRHELGRYKTSKEYRRYRHNERHLANSSFTFGMVGSIGRGAPSLRGLRPPTLMRMLCMAVICLRRSASLYSLRTGIASTTEMAWSSDCTASRV